MSVMFPLHLARYGITLSGPFLSSIARTMPSGLSFTKFADALLAWGLMAILAL
jgi:hypothetical protein